MLPDAPYHYACDGKWWDIHYSDVKAGYKGVSHTIDDVDHPDRNPKPEYDLIRLKSKQSGGLGKEYIHYGVSGGGNSGFQAVNLAYQMGAGTIILLGFDMFGTHYFGKHPLKLDVNSPFKAFIQSFESITQDIEIINCTRSTALTCFKRQRLEDIL